MKNGSPCSKCRGTEIFYVPGGLMREQNHSVVGAFIPTIFRIARYVCVNCGYTEEWVDKSDDMDKMRSLARNS